jgi:four helix bundle protein
MPPGTLKKKIESYQDLIVWRKGVDLVVEIYALAAKLPATERFSLCSQLKRAAVSVPSNVAEGFGRWHAKEFAHFLLMANGSVKEIETQLHVCVRLGFLERKQTSQALLLATEISKMIFAIRNKLDSRRGSVRA